MIQHVVLAGLLLFLLTLTCAGWAGEPAFPPEREMPLELTATGYVSKFLVGWWEVGTETYDVDGDGTIDYIVRVGTRTGHTVGIVHEYGADPVAPGPAVFYSVRNARGETVEWAGNPTWPHHPPINSPGPTPKAQEAWKDTAR